MIYMEPHQLGWKPLKDSYMDTLPSTLTEEHKELVSRFPLPPGCPPPLEAFTVTTPGGAEGREPHLPVPGFLAAISPSSFSMWGAGQ